MRPKTPTKTANFAVGHFSLKKVTCYSRVKIDGHGLSSGRRIVDAIF